MAMASARRAPPIVREDTSSGHFFIKTFTFLERAIEDDKQMPTTTAPPDFETRLALTETFTRSLFERLDETVSAIVADGWSEKMTRAGLKLHQNTWNTDRMAQALEMELQGFGGLAALDRITSPAHTRDTIAYRLRRPREVIHVWPALPGAGLSPVLMGWLIGTSQIIRPSSRGEHFARLIYERSRDLMGSASTGLELLFGSPSPRWKDADALIVSGSDETIETLHGFLDTPGHRARPTLIGYGHRVSFTLIIDDGSDALLQDRELSLRCAQDIVMWHQQGCFSSRAVIFCGPHDRGRAFAERLGASIAIMEETLDARQLDDALLARRAQTRGVAEMMADVYGAGTGWVQMQNRPWRGEQISPHTVSFHTIQSVDEVRQVVKLPAHNLQGCALHAPASARRHCEEALCRLGVTRICKPGLLQSPPASWPHDGQPNMLDLLRITTIERV